MDSENIIIRSKKILLYPTLEQKKHLKNFIGVYRHFYNKTIEYINKIPREKTFERVKDGKGDHILYENEYINVKRMGDYKLCYGFIPQYITNKKGKKVRKNQTSLQTLRPIIKKDLESWAKKVPSHLIDCAIAEASKAFSSCMSRFKNNNKNFKLRFKNKRKLVMETIDIEKCYLSNNKNSIFPSILGNRIESSEPFKDLDKNGSSLTYHRRLGTFTLNISMNRIKKEYNQKEEMCALDPGVRTFMTMYSNEEVAHFGIGANEKLNKKCKEMDIIQSKITKKNKKGKKSLKKALHRKIRKIKNMRDDLHYKVINYLTKKYKKIVLPPFETSNMIQNLNHLISRNMNTLSFYKFKCRMKEKCEERGVELIIGTEEYTTKTCTRCGKLNNVGSSKIYKCSSCKLIIERDINGARNIYLKHSFIES